jgi:vanillate O-demethylase monooxygenase subunit
MEKFGWVWVWMGEAAKANPAMVPDFHWLNDPAFAAVGKTNHVQCAYQLVTDNLMDLSHVGFVHTTTIGNAEFGEKGRLTARRSETGVTVKRLVPDVPTPPTYIQLGVLPAGKNIDRWQIVDFIPPCFVRIHVGGKEAGTGALEGRFEQGLNMWVINAMTPETEHSTHYFWANVRQHALGDKRIDELLFSQVSAVFEEDRVVLEAQQRSLLNRADTWSVALRQDEGSILARRVVEKMIEDERGK